MRSRAIDDPVDERAAKPAAQGRRVAELVVATPRRDQRLLGTVLGGIDVAGQASRQPDQPWQLGQQRLPERGAAFIRDHVQRPADDIRNNLAPESGAGGPTHGADFGNGNAERLDDRQVMSDSVSRAFHDCPHDMLPFRAKA